MLHILKEVLAVIVFSSTLLAIPIFVSIPPASAAVCGTTAHNFAGTSDTPQTNYYAQAQITTQPTTLCGAADSVSLAWVMIADNAGNGWTQSGYIWRQGITGSYLFAQYSKNGSAWYTAYYASAPSTALYYELYDFNGAAMDLVAHGYQLLTTPWDPVVEWSAPWLPEWEGETVYPGDDVPGTQASPTYFSSLGIKTTRSGSIVSPSGLSLHASYSNYGAAWGTSVPDFHIWSKS
jgi:hypothetical protein